MNLKEFLIVSLEGIKNNKLRSFLTTLGIVIGIAAVILVMAIGEGGKAMIIGELEQYGTNIFQIYPNYREGEYVRLRDFTKEDITVVKALSSEVKYLAPMKYERQEIRGSEGKKTVQVIGTTTDYQYIRNLEIQWGRFFNEQDDAVGRRVIVLDEALANELFGFENPVGQRVMIEGGNSALVVGVIKKRESQLPGMQPDQNAYIPVSFMVGSSQWEYVNMLMGSAASKEMVYQAMDRTKKILERRHNTTNHYDAYSMEQEMEMVGKVTGIMSLIISSIAGISLFVGGIGVMNIMLVSVTERTREIGIRMALGATRKDILTQFLIEAVVLCSAGGVIGICIGYAGSMVASYFLNLPPLVSWWTALFAFLFSAIIGVFFGIYPANKASKLDPIVALRRE
ncbi:ABC transporter permease [Peptococcaceae bacterium 1198_IL3148]